MSLWLGQQSLELSLLCLGPNTHHFNQLKQLREKLSVDILTFHNIAKSTNEAPSDVNITVDGSTYPQWKMSRFEKQNKKFSIVKNAAG